MQQDGERKPGAMQLLSAGEVAKMLSLSRLHVQTLAVSRELPGVWLENTLLFHLRDVENYLRAHRKETLAIA
jgi:Helix-turn-helix domain